jgi:hypothetical protein
MIATELQGVSTTNLPILARTIWRLASHHRRRGNYAGEARNRQLLELINAELLRRFDD